MKISKCGSAVEKKAVALLMYSEVKGVEGIYEYKNASNLRLLVVGNGSDAIRLWVHKDSAITPAYNPGDAHVFTKLPNAILCLEIVE